MAAISNPLEIVYRDNDLVAINKPAGLLVHRSRIDVHAREFALQILRDQLDSLVFPVHRIDRPTSGLLLFGLSSEIARELAEQFAQRKVNKTYRAIVRGTPPKTGRWEEALHEKRDSITDIQVRDNKPPQPAITEYRSIRNWEIPFSTGKYPHSRYSEVCIHPLTGRKHQIRRHFNHMAHPVIGDSTYGDRRHNRLFREKLKVSRLLLAAYQLEFTHPVEMTRMKLEAAPGIEFDYAIQQLEKNCV